MRKNPHPILRKNFVYKILGAGLFVFTLLALKATPAAAWERIEINANVSASQAIAIEKDNPGVIYVGFKEALYKTRDAGKTWEALAPGLISELNFLYIDKEDPQVIYAATLNGLFKSQDAGGTWQKIFSGKDVLERDVLSLAVSYRPHKIVFIGTESGIFYSSAEGLRWQKVAGKLADAKIKAIIADSKQLNMLYIVSSKGLFKTSDNLSSYERIYTGFNPESEDATIDVDSGEEEITPQDYFLSHLAINPENSQQLYLAGLNGLSFSSDEGKSWKKLILSGLFEEKINYLLLSENNRIFLATQNGIFDCAGISCKQLYPGMNFKDCEQLARDREGNLYAACDRGLYLMSAQDYKMHSTPFKTENKATHSFPKEPTIQQVQQRAIRYAEVEPGKISGWRKQARLKAFFPELTLDYDKTVTTALGATYDRVQVGPRDWGLTLKWDIGDIVFSTEQTSIDVRSRLMVQLRDDILNEVTRLYFERKRLQRELALSPNLSPEVREEKDLRLQELTASIDGLTGGYLTKSLNNDSGRERF